MTGLGNLASEESGYHFRLRGVDGLLENAIVNQVLFGSYFDLVCFASTVLKLRRLPLKVAHSVYGFPLK